jgi:ribosomal protein S12 methylthiotransferase accessory factor YcaO
MKKNKLILNKKEILNVLGKEYINLSSIMSDKIGIINAILERNELSKFNLYMYQCLSTNTKILYDLDRNVTSGGLGVSNSKKNAMISCLVEAVERYCMTFVPQKEVIFEYWDNLERGKKFNNFFYLFI